MQSVDRSVTPWLLVTLHAPLYNSYAAHFKENECMRLEASVATSASTGGRGWCVGVVYVLVRVGESVVVADRRE